MKKILLIAILLISTLACGLAPDVAEVSESEQIATVVAATMAVAQPASGSAPLSPPNDSATAVVPTTENFGGATGLRVAYIREGNIWLWEEGIGKRQLTDTGEASKIQISDDGQIIAFSRQNALWSISAEGGTPIKLVDQAYLTSVPHNADNVGTPMLDTYEFIPGTHILFFDIFMATESYFIPYGGLHRVDADAPVPAQVLLDGQSGLRYYSPDKAWVALSQPNHIAVMRVDGSAYRTLFDFSPILTYSEWFFQPEVVWKNTSDGFYIALPATDYLGNPNDTGHFWYIGLEGVVAQLATFPAGPVWEAAPKISPDGIKVLYLKEIGAGREIHIIDASTADISFIASPDANLGLLGWADNDHFGFWYGDRDKPLYASLSTRSQQDLTDVSPTLSQSVTWLADGRLLFQSQRTLRLSALGAPSLIIDAPVDSLDFDAAE